jgi:hypothetical protein
MIKHFASKDYVVVKDFKTELLKAPKHLSEVNKHNEILFEGTRLECLVWSKARNKEEEKLVEQWAELRAQRRIPLPSQDISRLDAMIEDLHNKLGDIVNSSKESISKALQGTNQKAVIAARPTTPEQSIQR